MDLVQYYYTTKWFGCRVFEGYNVKNYGFVLYRFDSFLGFYGICFVGFEYCFDYLLLFYCYMEWGCVGIIRWGN